MNYKLIAQEAVAYIFEKWLHKDSIKWTDLSYNKIDQFYGQLCWELSSDGGDFVSVSHLQQMLIDYYENAGVITKQEADKLFHFSVNI